MISKFFVFLYFSIATISNHTFSNLYLLVDIVRYQAHPPTQLIKRLTLRSQHLLSIKISEFLSLPPSTIGEILKHWAKEKIQLVKSNNSGNTSSSGNKEREDEVCKIIVEKLKLNRNSSTGNGNVGMNGGDGISCADIAETAWNEGMNGLATKVNIFTSLFLLSSHSFFTPLILLYDFSV